MCIRDRVKRDENGLPQLMVGRISNIGKQNKFDNVTGLMNRQQFEKDLKHLLKQTTMEGIVVVLDVDNFKNINEKYSYAFGDRTLNFIARELTTLLPDVYKRQ